MGKQNGKTGGNGNMNGWDVFPTVFTVPVFSRENSRGNSRICRSRLCYLCWKCELLFAFVPTWIMNSWFTLLVFLSYTSLVSMLFMHSCNYFIELNVWSGCMYFPVLSYRFPIVIGMLPTDWFRSRYPVIPISFSRPIFPFPFPFPTKKYSCGNGWGVFPTVPDRFHPYRRCMLCTTLVDETNVEWLWLSFWCNSSILWQWECNQASKQPGKTLLNKAYRYLSSLLTGSWG